MRYLSVCSGVEAASVAWEHLGWTPVGFSEIEPFPSAVLKHRFPNVPNFGDMTKYKEWPIEPGTVDVLVGGTPCQSFSVAGLRKGLDDPRGNLMLVYLGLAEHFRIPWLVWENVPGVLSSNGGRDFGTFLGALGELGYEFSWRILDAQHFGVPQRRRRVFVIAHLGDGPHPAKVLLEPESVCRDHPKSRAKAEKIARGSRQGAESGGRVGVDIVGTLCSDTHPGAYSGQDAYTGRLVPQVVTATGTVTHAMDYAHGATEDGMGRGTPIVPAIAFQLVSDRANPRVSVSDDTAFTLSANPMSDRGQAIAFHPTQDPISLVEVTHTKTRPTDGSEGGTGSRQGTATVAVATVTEPYTLAIRGRENGASLEYRQDGTANAILTPSGGRAGMGVGAIAFAQNTRDEVRLIGGDGQTVGALAAQPGMKQTTYLATTDVTGTLSSRGLADSEREPDFEVAGGLQPIVAPTLTAANDPSRSPQSSEVTQQVAAILSAQPTMAVRRLLPVECERLQGFPTVTESVRLTVCFDPTRKSARVAMKCHKWHGNASSADDGVYPRSVEPAAHALSIGQAAPETLAVLAVRQNSVTVHLVPLKTERWNSSAKSAERSSAYLPPTEAGNTAQELARLAHALGVEATHGRVESLLPSDSSLPDVNGNQSVNSCGQDTADFVVDVTLDQSSDTFTTFALGRTSPKVVSTRATLCCSVLRVIGGCIPDAILPESFCVDLMVESEWTAIPWKNKPASECPDGPRYKAMGNSFAVPVVRWIGERLDAVAKGKHG